MVGAAITYTYPQMMSHVDSLRLRWDNDRQHKTAGDEVIRGANMHTSWKAWLCESFLREFKVKLKNRGGRKTPGNEATHTDKARV